MNQPAHLEKSPGRSEKIEQEAAEWVVLEDRGLSASEQEALDLWLANSPHHKVCLEEKRRDWVLMSQLGGRLRATQSRIGRIRKHRPQLNACLGWLQASLPIAAAILMGLLILRLAPSPASRAPEPAAFAIAPAAREIRLEDGTRIVLKPGANLTEHYTASERLVVLNTGSASFHVAKCPGRPFVVVAGGARMQALGTVFDVDLNEEAIQLRVTEGRVRLSTAEAGAASPVLIAGESAYVASGVPSQGVRLNRTPEGQALQSQVSEPRLLEFSGAPLSKVVDELNSLNRLQLRLSDPTLATLPVVASIRSDNVEGFARLLCAEGSLVYHKSGDTFVVSRASHGVTGL